MSFSIEAYDGNHLEGMTTLYNRESASEPYIAPFCPERFVELVERKSYFDPEGLLVAVEKKHVVGWIHACVAPGSEAHHDPTMPIPRIRMLVFPRERLQVGSMLVSEATAWLQQAGQRNLLAMHAEAGYPFYRGLWYGGEPMGPTSFPHLHVAFETKGYKTTQESSHGKNTQPA